MSDASIVRKIDYLVQDADGKLVAIHTRIELSDGRKRFAWKRPDGQSGLNGTPTADLLYGAELLRKHPRAKVIRTEGEKAADALRKVVDLDEYVPVANVCGAPKPFGPSVAELLRGRWVGLWPDNDGDGRRQVDLDAEQLEGVASDLRIIAWPSAPAKGDAYDFCASHNTDELLALLAASEPWARASDEDQPTHDDATRDWRRRRLDAALDDDDEDDAPTYLVLPDGSALLYPGRVHWISGEPESMKSWLAQIVAAEAMKADRDVLYLDFESDMRPIVRRFRALGLDKETIRRRLCYVRPETPLTDATEAALMEELGETLPSVSVIDGVNVALAMCGFEPNSTRDVANWWTRVAHPVRRATSGPTLAVDHVTKDKETRGRWAIGSQHKMAAVDGAHIGVEVLKPFGRGLTGKAKLTVQKDRPGWLRGRYHYKIGVLTLTSEIETGGVSWTIDPEPEGEGGEEGSTWRPTNLMEKLSRYLETCIEPVSQTVAIAGVIGKERVKVQALDFLVKDGYAAFEEGTRNSKLYRSLRPYRDPSDDRRPTAAPPPPGGGDETTATAAPPPYPPKGGGAGGGRIAAVGTPLGSSTAAQFIEEDEDDGEPF